MDDSQEKRYELWLGNELLTYSFAEIKSDPQLERDLQNLERKKAECEIAWFTPHGASRMGYDCGFQLASMADWMNDREHTIAINCAPNQVGKTCHAVVKKVLKIIPCDPEWQIFKNGIKYYEWQGKKTLVVCGYDKGQLRDVLFPEIQKWFPASELGPYRSTSLGGDREPAWDRNARITLQCGSRIIFLTYDQKASVAAGVKCEEVLPDEQMPLTFFNELDQRGRTRGGVWWDFCFTPHKVDGRPDTGMSGWLHDLWTGHNTRGHKIIRTRISVDDVPNHIYSKEEKKKAYIQWVESPTKSGDQQAIREGKARYYGLFESTSGLFYPEIDPNIHYVDWTWDDIKGKGWTCYRSMDYGYQNPTACGMWAASPSGELFMFDEYYRTGLDAIGHAPAIIEHCGNERKLLKKMFDNDTGNYWDVYTEIEIRQKYVRTWLDWHSFQNAGGVGRPVSFFFQIGGLNVCESSKLGQEARAQNLRALLKIDPNRKHMVTGKLGAPRMYFSRKCVKMIWEFERCIVDTRSFGNESHNSKETKRNKDDHLVDQAEYVSCESPKYLGDYASRKPRELQNISSHGGY
jgi:hypothetical protein